MFKITKPKFKFSKFRKQNKEYIKLWKIIPNTITLIALSLGATSIIFTIQHDWSTAIFLILIAAFLDGIDGRIARFLHASSPFGAELDSLCDFVNFGIAPALLNYFWLNSLQGVEISKINWCFSLIYCACIAIRLARFNVLNQLDNWFNKKFFLGVPAPCCAMLLLSPMLLNFEYDIITKENTYIYLAYCIFISFLCISTIPTFCLKTIAIKKKYIKVFFFILICMLSFLLINPWLFLPLISLLYLFSIPFSYYYANLLKNDFSIAEKSSEKLEKPIESDLK